MLISYNTHNTPKNSLKKNIKIMKKIKNKIKINALKYSAVEIKKLYQ